MLADLFSSGQRHTYTKAGQKTSSTEWLGGFFNSIKNVFFNRHGSINKRQKKSQLANAEFHLSPEQIRKIIQGQNNLRNRVIIELLAYTGVRRSEVVSLNIEDIDWTRRLMVIRNGKGNKLRFIPLTKSLIKNLKSLIGQHATGPIFVSRNNNRLSIRQINRIVAIAGKTTGVTNPNPKYANLNPHLFRHSFARLWKDRGGSIESLSKILGHDSVKTTWDIYGSESLEDICRNYEIIMK